jgi:hypothetical protein
LNIVFEDIFLTYSHGFVFTEAAPSFEIPAPHHSGTQFISKELEKEK